MESATFHTIADTTLMQLYDSLEPLYEKGHIEELELENGILTIATTSDITFVINKHASTHEIWLASPISGGHHFSFNSTSQEWTSKTQDILIHILKNDLAHACNQQTIF